MTPPPNTEHDTEKRTEKRTDEQQFETHSGAGHDLSEHRTAVDRGAEVSMQEDVRQPGPCALEDGDVRIGSMTVEDRLD